MILRRIIMDSAKGDRKNAIARTYETGEYPPE